MADADSKTDVLNWHRQIAMECNNRAWELSVQDRTPAENGEMLTAAHTSAFHWNRIGTELNRMRATMLLAEVHGQLGHGTTALAYAETMRTYFLSRSDTPDWEITFAHAIHAQCAHAAGDFAAHRESYAKAATAVAAIAETEDREIVLATFQRVPPVSGS
jgi:hypothetical protein